MLTLIAVSHLNGAWRLDVEGCEPRLYLSGGNAERDARRLACCLAECGCEAQVHIRDKQDVLVGDHCFYAA